MSPSSVPSRSLAATSIGFRIGIGSVPPCTGGTAPRAAAFYIVLHQPVAVQLADRRLEQAIAERDALGHFFGARTTIMPLPDAVRRVRSRRSGSAHLPGAGTIR